MRFGSGIDDVSCGKLADVEGDRFGSVAGGVLPVCCEAFGESVLPLFCEPVVVRPVSVAVAGGVAPPPP